MKNPIQITAESIEPSGAAMPIGNSDSGKRIEAKYAPGIRTNRMEIRL